MPTLVQKRAIGLRCIPPQYRVDLALSKPCFKRALLSTTRTSTMVHPCWWPPGWAMKELFDNC